MCKGEAVQSSYKVKQHLKLYGLWDSKKSIEGPSPAKKSRINESDSSTNSDSSDSDRDKEECIVEDRSGNEYCDDDGYANEFLLSGSDQEKSTSAKVQSYKVLWPETVLVN